jgi:hypothetical protein
MRRVLALSKETLHSLMEPELSGVNSAGAPQQVSTATAYSCPGRASCDPHCPTQTVTTSITKTPDETMNKG